MWFFAEDRGTALIGKICRLGLDEHEKTKDVFAQFYGILSILDVKATGLLTVNALFGAILTAMVADHDALLKNINVTVDDRLIEVQFALVAASSLLCLLIIRITWQFLEYIPDDPKTEADFTAELQRLANVIDDRTHYYWIAWWLALIAFGATLAWWSPIAAIVLAVVIILWLNARR